MGSRVPTSAAFWTFLIIVIIIGFFMLMPVIKRNFKLNPETAETEQQQEQGTEEKKPLAEKPIVTEQPEKKPQTEKSAAPAQTSSPKTPEKEPEKKLPAPPAQPSTPPAPVSTPPVKPVETRDRSIYLIQESNMMLVKVNRNLNATLTDSINSLLAGPTPDEIMRDIESFVPEGSRLISARVEGSTAVLDFNQEFRYNPRGREGCAAQIKQIVWTATEFPNVKDVQFQIEGQKVDFLSEGVVIRNPIGRENS
jgi:hypothetical protein